MTDQTYALAKSGVFGLQSGVYQDSLVTTLDGFEDNDISEYGGATGGFTTQSTTVKDGSYALATSSPGGSHLSDTGVTTNQGNTYRVWTRFGSSSGSESFLFATQSETSTTDCYMVMLFQGGGEYRLYRYDGSYNNIASSAISPSTGTWYEHKIDWATDGTITCTLLDSAGSQVVQISATDTTWTSGGIGFRGDNGPSAYFDTVREV